MKNLLLNGILLVSLTGMIMVADAQDIQKEAQKKVTVKVEKKGNGRVQILERQLDVTGMSKHEREEAIQSLQDSLTGDNDNDIRVKVTIEEREHVDIEGENELDLSDYGKAGARMLQKQKGAANGQDEFEWEMEKLGDEMRRLGEELPQKLAHQMPRMYAWTDKAFTSMEPSGLRSVDVFPNKPESNIINVRFFAAEEGDVTITVVDTKGKIMASKEAKSFKGEFVGQLELDKAKTGTYFVIISQGEDAISRKVAVE